MAEKEEGINFKVPKGFAERMRRNDFDKDVSVSEWLRCWLMLASPILHDKSYLITAFENSKNPG